VSLAIALGDFPPSGAPGKTPHCFWKRETRKQQLSSSICERRVTAVEFHAVLVGAPLATGELDASRNAEDPGHPVPKPTLVRRTVLCPQGGVNRQGAYHGNAQSRLNHSPSCPNYNCKHCTIS
jgi:hypothetical protein